MGKALQVVPGITVSFQYPVQMRFNELMTGAKQDVVVKIFGENLDTLAQYAEKMSSIIQSVKGAKEIYVEPVTGLPQIIINYNRQAIAQYNSNIADINKVVNAAFAGQVAGVVYEGEKHFDMVVRLAGQDRGNVKDVQNLLIPLHNGQQIPLSQLATVSIMDGPNQIQREDAKRRIIVGFNVGDRDVQSIVHELQDKVESQVDFPAGYYPTYGGAFENLNEALGRLMIAVPLSLLLIFLLLYFAFHSVRQGLLIYSAIPLSAIGGIFLLALRGMPFSISAGVGFIALFGIAVLNGIVLIAEFNRLKNDGMTSLKEIVLTGSKTRLRPVLMTASVASLGFLPMALSQGAGAEVQRPLATVVIGGLLIATFLTLYVLPVLYIMFEKRSFQKLMNKTGSTLLLFLIIGFSVPAISQAQTMVTLEGAKDSAIKNSLLIRDQKLNELHLQKLIKTAAEIPHTNVAGTYGQIASIYKDNEIGINQVLSFPTIYKKQKVLLTEEYKSGSMAVEMKILELKKQVSEVFNTLLYLNEQKKLLLRADSIYSEFLKKANLRFEKGESNVLEQATAQNQQGQIATQLDELHRDIEINNYRFQLLLNSKETFIPVSNSFKMDFKLGEISTDISQMPGMKLLEQQKQIALANTQVQKSKLLPDILFGYNNSSMRGVGADDKYYSGSKRFHSVHAGVGIPLFNGAQKARVAASGINETIAENNISLGMITLENNRKTALMDYRKYLNTLQWYENTGLKNAEVINSTAEKQFVNGDINYLEWVLLVNQAVSIQSQYLESLKKLNESIIELNYLFNK